jgi:flagellar biosynthetic protein FliQ
MDVFKEAILIAFKLGGPLLFSSMIIGLIIAIFQAATQIHEQTLTFVPKVLLIAIMLLVLGPWMITMLSEFMQSLFVLIKSI